MAAQPRGGAGGPDRPWSSVFEPAANARALADIQAQGLRAAGELVERLIRAVDGDRRRATPADGTEPDTAALPEPPGGGATRVVEVWLDLLRQTADSFGRLTSSGAPGAPTGQIAVDVTSGVSSGELRVELATTDTEADREVWLHNGTAAAVGPLRLHCGVPRSSDGIDLDAGVSFEPEQVDELPARSSRGVAVSVRATGSPAPGSYRAVVQAAGIDDLWLPLVVVVPEPVT